jgi:5-methylthioadenosine/S-adenosylhomocysteine deaminase
MTERVDRLIIHAHLLTMAGDGVGYVADGAVAVQETRIVAVGSTADLVDRYHAPDTIDAADSLVMPGLVDAHMHTPWAVVRGVAQDVGHWMQRALAPYARHLTGAASLAGTRLNVLEALKAGTTLIGRILFLAVYTLCYHDNKLVKKRTGRKDETTYART